MALYNPIISERKVKKNAQTKDFSKLGKKFGQLASHKFQLKTAKLAAHIRKRLYILIHA